MRQRLFLLIAMVVTAILGPLTAIAVAAGSGGAAVGADPSATSSACAAVTTPAVTTTSTAATPAVTTTPTVATTRTSPTVATTRTSPTVATTTSSISSTSAVTAPTTCTTTTAVPTKTTRTPTITAPVPTFTTTTPVVTLTTKTTTKTTPSKTTTTTTTSTTTTASYPYIAATNTAPAPSVIPVPKQNPFTGRGMWIWIMGDTDHGNVAQIIATAKANGIGTLMIKSGDGSHYWSQFSPTLVAELHAAGLKVCAWQYVYGSTPVAEAEVGARAVTAGADCLVIDAESQYQGKYVQAQTYIDTLRELIGSSFPVGLAGFPYVSYHLSFPYSVFLGPNGAQYNVPQMYWQDIGVSPATVYSVTYAYNEIYQRPIFPLGQLFDHVPSASVAQFTSLADSYGAQGVSWWDWQSSNASELDALSTPGTLPKGFVRQKTAASVPPKSSGDLVLWAQEHLYSAGYKISIDGTFGAQTREAVVQFQTRHGLPASGTITGATWDALLRYRATEVRWSARKHGQVPTVVTPGTTITVTLPDASTTTQTTTTPVASAGGGGDGL